MAFAAGISVLVTTSIRETSMLTFRTAGRVISRVVSQAFVTRNQILVAPKPGQGPVVPQLVGDDSNHACAVVGSLIH